MIFEIFTFKFSLLEFILLGVLFLSLFIQFFYYIYYYKSVIKATKTEHISSSNFDKTEPVSVIICAKNEVENLQKFLPLILAQDYPDYEVIVVNDASQDDTEDYIELMKKSNPHLRSTFVPQGATNISTKKLGLSLGIKASVNNILLFTDADCMPEGDKWIENMVRNFDSKVEFVIGYGGYFEKKGFLNKLIRFDTLFIAMQYLGMTLRGKPYMGVGRNMAYRKDAFYKYGGFSTHLNISSGDDDLLINRAGKAENSIAECSIDAATWSEPKRSFKEWLNQKRRHLSVSNIYTTKSKIRLALEPISRATFYIATILSIIFGNLITIGIAVFILILRNIVQYSIINRTAKNFKENISYPLLIVFDILLPIISLKILFFEKNRKKFHWK